MPRISRIPPPSDSANNQELVQHYIRYRRPILESELREFSEKDTFFAALEIAVHARNAKGKRFDHQRRLKRHVIPRVWEISRYREPQLQECKTFQELFSQVEFIMKKVPNAGDLYKYDTALRIGAKLGLAPEAVYLQTGALKGARRLLPGTKCRTLPKDAFPKEFQPLSCSEIENFLCSYKDRLKRDG